MMNEKQIWAGNIGDITFMCSPAILPIMKRGNEAIGSKVNFPTSYPGLFASAVGWSAKKALASAGLFCNLIGQ
jgi:hypothetical protein